MSNETAAVSWQDNGIHLRVYSTDGKTVTEKCWDTNNWYVGAFKEPGQSASATAWFNGGVYIRVYVTDSGKTSEYCWDKNGPWYKGAYTG
jgi:hypothetical protein